MRGPAFDARLGKTPMPLLTMSALSKAPNVLTVGGVHPRPASGGSPTAAAKWPRPRAGATAGTRTTDEDTLPRITGWRVIATALILAGAVSALARFTYGLGATTNLSDEFPWGLWIGFDFLGIGLAAAGFTIVAAVNLFHAKDYEPIVRPAILTAFIGYLLVVLVLIIDLGRPDHFWHPLVMWNPHSVMCEISWCLMLYTTVLSLEFAPIVLEKFTSRADQVDPRHLPAAHDLRRAAVDPAPVLLRFPLPDRPEPAAPPLVHAAAAGAVLHLLHRLRAVHGDPGDPDPSRNGPHLLPTRLRANLAKIIAMALAVYLVVRIQDLLTRGVLPRDHPLTYYSLAFYAEILVGFVDAPCPAPVRAGPHSRGACTRPASWSWPGSPPTA